MDEQQTTINSKHLEKWEQDDQLALIEHWVRIGTGLRSLSGKMGISRKTLYNWLNASPKLQKAVDSGCEDINAKAESVLFRKLNEGDSTVAMFILKNGRHSSYNQNAVKLEYEYGGRCKNCGMKKEVEKPNYDAVRTELNDVLFEGKVVTPEEEQEEKEIAKEMAELDAFLRTLRSDKDDDCEESEGSIPRERTPEEKERARLALDKFRKAVDALGSGEDDDDEYEDYEKDDCEEDDDKDTLEPEIIVEQEAVEIIPDPIEEPEPEMVEPKPRKRVLTKPIGWEDENRKIPEVHPRRTFIK